MKLNHEIVKKAIKDWKYIHNTPGIKKYQDWLFFANNKLFSYNGYFMISTDYPSDLEFALHVNCEPLLSEGTEIGCTEDASFIKKGKQRIEYSYPFVLSEKIKEFMYDSEELSTLVPENIQDAFKYIFKENIEYSNVYIENGKMLSTDSYRIFSRKTKCIDTVLPYGIHKIVNEDIRGIRDFGYGMTVVFGNYRLSCGRTSGKAELIYKFIPSTINRKDVVVSEDILSSLEVAKKFSSEFKKKDLSVILEFGDEVHITIDGVKSKFEDFVSYTGDVPGLIAQGHPDHFIDFFNCSLGFSVTDHWFHNEDTFLWTGN